MHRPSDPLLPRAAKLRPHFSLSRFPEAGTHIPFPDVVQQGDDDALPNSPGRLVSTIKVSAGRLSGENTVLCQDGAHARSVDTGNTNLLIDDRLVKDFGNDIPGTLQRLETFDSRKILRHDLNDLHTRYFLL